MSPPAKIKIDMEGFEDEVILGAMKILRNENVKAVLLEMKKPELIDNLLTGYGFAPETYDVFIRMLTETAYDVKANLIYVRGKSFADMRIKSAELITVNGKKSRKHNLTTTTTV